MSDSPVQKENNELIETVEKNLQSLGEALNNLEKTTENMSKIASDGTNPGADVNGEGEVTGGTFVVDEDVHGALSDDLDEFINKAGQGYSNISGAGKRVSKEVRTLKTIHAAASDMKSKLEVVNKQTADKLNTLQAIKSILETNFSKLHNAFLSIPGANEEDIKTLKKINKEILNDLEDNINSLFGLLKLKDFKVDIDTLIKKNEKYEKVAEKLGMEPHTSEASDRLALAYTNLHELQLLTNKINNSLKKLKISQQEYSKLKSVSDLQHLLPKILKEANTKGDPEKIADIMKNVEEIKKNFKHHNKVVDCMKGKGCSKIEIGGAFDNLNEIVVGPRGMGEVDGGAYDTSLGRVTNAGVKSTLKSRITSYEKTVKEIFNSFISQVSNNFMEISKSVDNVSEQFGNEVPYDDNVKLFISIFEGFESDLNNKKIFYALIGLDLTPAGKEVKSRFMDNLNKLIESLSQLSSYKYLSEIKRQLVHVKENIDVYSDTVTGVKNTSENYKSGKGQDFTWNDALVDISVSAKASKLLKTTITKLKFFGNISSIKDNLQRMSKEHSYYSKDYEKLLGKTIGAKLNEINKENVESIDRLNDKERGRGYLLETYNKGVTAKEDKIPRTLIETIYKIHNEAKVGLYETVEAIDIYLMNFTEELSKNVEAVKELNVMLKQTNLISKWFDKNSMDNAVKLVTQLKFEEGEREKIIEFAGETVIFNAGIYKKGIEIRNILESCKNMVESVAVIKNIVAMFIHIGDKFGSKQLSKDNIMSPNLIYKNFIKYIWVSAFTMGYGTAGGDVDVKVDSLKKDKGDYEKETGDLTSFFGMKLNSIIGSKPMGSLKADFIKMELDKLNKFYPPLKNAIIKFENVSMPISKINEFMEVTSKNKNKMKFDNIEIIIDDKASVIPFTTNKAVVCLKYVIVQYINFDKDIFAQDDKYFILSLKAIAGKILTVVGTSNLLRHPAAMHNLITNPVRSIIGAYEAEVNDEAVELYIRLPLLLEFYKNIFDNGNSEAKKNKNEDNESEIIAFIPEIGSIWSGLIQCIFDDSKQIANGIYSRDNMNKIISEINKIYKNYKNVEQSKLTKVVILDLIAEVNKRYGVMKRKEINDFYQIKKKYTNNIDDMNFNSVDYNILDDDNDYKLEGPSSKYKDLSMDASSNYNNKFATDDYSIIKEFRDKIHNELFVKDLKEISKNSFVEKIKYFKNEIKSAIDKQSKIDIIIKAIDKASNVSAHNIDMFVLMHEFVDFPLRCIEQSFILYSTLAFESMLNNMFVHGASLLDNDELAMILNSDSVQDLSVFVRDQNEDLSKIIARLPQSQINLMASQLIAVNMKVQNKLAIDNCEALVDALTMKEFKNIQLQTTFSSLISSIRNVHATLDIRDGDGNRVFDKHFSKFNPLRMTLEYVNGSQLIKLKTISEGTFILDFSLLQDTVENEINTVKYMLSKFRNNVPSTIVAPIEKKLNEIEDLFLVQILQNQNNSDNKLAEFINSEIVNNALLMTQKEMKTNILANTADIMTTLVNETDYISANEIINNNDLLKDVFSKYSAKDRQWVSDVGSLTNVYLLDYFTKHVMITDNVNMASKGLNVVYKFNYLLYSYLSSFYDISNKKIYNGLFNNLVNKSQSDAIFGHNCLADMYEFMDRAPNQTVFLQGKGQVLTQTLSYTLNVLSSRNTNSQLSTKYHLLTSISEVSPNLIEQYKAKLPLFRSYFESILFQCIEFKKIYDSLSSDEIGTDNGVDSLADNMFIKLKDINGSENKVSYKSENYSALSNSSIKLALNETLNNMIDATRAVINDINNVYSEIDAKPQFAETKENFIKNYYNNYKELPLMNNSILSLTSLSDASSLKLFNYNKNLVSMNENNLLSRYYYATNIVLNSNESNDDMNNYLWLKEFVTKYNNSALKVNVIDVNRVKTYITHTNALSKFIYKVNVVNSFITQNYTKMTTAIHDTFYTKHTLSDGIGMIENGSGDLNKTKIANFVNNNDKLTKSLNRENARLLNIIDLNVNPINFHALLRDFPIANIYNYAFTFDNIVKNELSNIENINDAKTWDDVFSFLLRNPYAYSNLLLSGTNETFKLKIDDKDYEISNFNDIIKYMIKAHKKYNSSKYISDILKQLDNVDNKEKVSIFLHSKLFRNILFATNLQKFILHKVRKEIERIDSNIVSDVGIVNERITSYDNEDETYNENEFEYFME